MVALVAIGAVLRVLDYLLNPALSSDEAALALNLMHRSVPGLFNQPLDVLQAAPPGFLVLQKLVITVFGPGPHALRLLPLAAALGALILLYPVAKRFVGVRAAVLALALFAISDPLITYAATNKQYSVDVAVALALYAVVLARRRESFATREALLLALSTGIAVWLSHAAVFVVAAIVTALLFEAARGRRWADLAWIFSVVTVWLGAFAAAYFLAQGSVARLQSALAGTHPTSLLGDQGLIQTYGGLVRALFGIPAFSSGIRNAIAVVAFILVVSGAVALCRAQPTRAALLIAPGIFALLAMQLDKYAPFPRAFLFLIPALVILAARGALSLTAAKRAQTVVLGVASFVIVLAAGAYATSDHLVSRRDAVPLRVLRYLTEHSQRGDSLYVHVSAQLDFRYYLECGCFGTPEMVRKARSLWPVQSPASDSTFFRSASPDLVAGTYTEATPSAFRSDLAPLRRSARIWILMMDPTARDQRALVTYLRKNGRQTDIFPRQGSEASATVLLFDLRRR